MHILEVKSLTKRYGSRYALHDVDLAIQSGMVYGLLGPNGSGKTTMLSIILDVVKATSGSYLWFGEHPHYSHRQRVGAILEKPNFIMRLSGLHNLQLVCKIKECPTSRIDDVLDIVGLADRADDRFKTYSLGMKQRLAIAAALINDPDVLILDEPTNGLDPTGISEIRDIIRQIAADGKTIILASHLLDEVQKVCDHFGVLREGKLIYQGSVAEDFSDHQRYVIGSEDLDRLSAILLSMSVIRKVDPSDRGLVTAHATSDTPPTSILKHIVDQGLYPTHFEQVHRRLEDRFIDIITHHD